ncbi:MAG: carboxypeptidase-like regulatory domain-containing protein [Candidatus Micrarchaeia archaeon]
MKVNKTKQSVFIFLILFPILSFALSCPPGYYEVTGIYGYVVDEETRDPLPNIRIMVGGDSEVFIGVGDNVRTNSEGFYNVSFCTNTDENVVSANAYEWINDARGENGEYLGSGSYAIYEVPINITLKRRYSWVSGRLEDSSGKPISGAIITIKRIGSNFSLETISNESGMFGVRVEGRSIGPLANAIDEFWYDVEIDSDNFIKKIIKNFSRQPEPAYKPIVLTLKPCGSSCPYGTVQQPYPDCTCKSSPRIGCNVGCPIGFVQMPSPECTCVSEHEEECPKKCGENETQLAFPDCRCIKQANKMEGIIQFLSYVLAMVILVFVLLVFVVVVKGKRVD